jgi:aminopeptidase N|tara:strand:- start:7021 stop:7728 length:708 start_codon:yes stop_codon:yes gene_type:complete
MNKERNIIAIGGGGFGRNPGEGIIEEYILKQTKKKRPNICFIPTATGDNEAYKVNYYATFSKLNCNPTHLDFFKRTPDLKRLIADQDAIFVGGGNTKSMLAVWREWQLDKILKKAYKNGTVMSGVSAGAICWFQNGVTDSWDSNLQIMPCMNFIKGTCCPHYDEEPERKPTVKKLISNNKVKSIYAVDGGAALHIKNEKNFKSVSFKKHKNAYEVTLDKNNIIENSFREFSLLRK